MSNNQNIKQTKKDLYEPFIKKMIANDKKFGTRIVPRGLNSKSKKQDLKKYYDMMTQTKITLADLMNKVEENSIKQAYNLRKPIYADVLKQILTKQPKAEPKAYKVVITSTFEVEYKDRNKNLSGRRIPQELTQIETIYAYNENDLANKVEETFIYDADETDKAIYGKTNTYHIVDNSNLPSRNQNLQMMKLASSICKEWLQYAKDISKTAFDETNNECVYYQLSKFLNNPPTNRPQKNIDQKLNLKTDKEGLFKFFSKVANENKEDYPDFNIKSGVSTDMIIKLCMKLERSCYAYDEDDKCFNKYVIKNKNYCPIAFYKFNGHMFLIDNPKAFKRIAETNKQADKICLITSMIDKEDKNDNELQTEYLQSFDVSNAKNYESKFYVINKHSIIEEFIQYIKLYKTEPKNKTNENVLTQFEYLNDNNELVVLSCDRNYGKINLDEQKTYECLQQICMKNDLTYKNQGIGTIIQTLLDKQAGYNRKYLNDENKKIIRDLYNNKCAICKLDSDNFQYDHIIPLANGGSNNMDNFQLLCYDCHLEKTIDETNEGYGIKNEIYSSFNNIVYNQVINTHHFKAYQFVEFVNKEHPDLPIYKTDTKRCRKNLTYYSKYEFPVYCVMDMPKNYSGTLQCGYYYVKTNNTFPLRACGWYCQPLVEYCLKLNIIENENILYEFIPSKKLPYNYFQDKIDYLLDCFKIDDAPEFQKLCVNSMVGLWGINKKTASYTKFTTDEYEAGQWLIENSNSCVLTNKLTEDLYLYEAKYEREVKCDEIAYPLYAMILQMEAMTLHELETIITNNGGIVLDRNTDAVRYQMKKNINVNEYFWDDDKTIQKYQYEEPKPLKQQSMPQLSRTHKEYDFNIKLDIQINLTAEEIFNSNKSYLIQGRAGTGKTYLVNQIIELIKASKKKYECIAPTNKSARLINGITLDKLFHHSMNKVKTFTKWVCKLNYIIVDEISMVKMKFYRLLSIIKKLNPKIIFYICGDFKQFKPVQDEWDGDYENSPVIKDLCDAKMILTKCRRADEELFNMCLKAQEINVEEFKPTRETYLNIAYTHKTRIEVNDCYMNKFVEKSKDTPIFISKDINNPKTQDVKLLKGMPVICHKTNKALNILNSDRFIIKSINDEKIILTNDIIEEDITISTDKFHKFLYLGFCITCHASQGETFNEPYTIYDWKMMNGRGKYVALSRGTSKNNIQVY